MHPQNNAPKRITGRRLNEGPDVERWADTGCPLIDSDHHARRLALMHTIGRAVDERTLTIDPTVLTPAEHIRDLTVALGDLARAEHDHDRIECLIEVAVLAQGQLEVLEREAST
jgi:hypothetical protein